MKSPSQTQSTTSTGTSIYPITLSNSIHEALSGNTLESSVFPPITIMTSTSPESETVHQRRRRLRMILDSAMAIIDGGEDFDPVESSTTKRQQLLQ
jgi:hypothetical protein